MNYFVTEHYQFCSVRKWFPNELGQALKDKKNNRYKKKDYLFSGIRNTTNRQVRELHGEVLKNFISCNNLLSGRSFII